MIKISKKVGETPLQLIDRIRTEQQQFAEEKLSYAGRLDPMAEGEMLILVGDENKNREKYMGFDKEYLATFMVGVSTDTGDILGLVKDSVVFDIGENFFDDLENSLKKSTQNLLTIKTQKYPWFSGKTVFGIKLFDHFRRGNFDIERPTQNVEIKSVEFLNFELRKSLEIYKYIQDSIGAVSGDFRQKEILESWEKYFKNFQGGADKGFIPPLVTFDIKITVSAGTFIRGLTENFGLPVTILKLKRTRILGLD